MMPKLIVRRCILTVLVLIFLGQGHVDGRAFEEYQLKAVFLYRLSLFITWPKSAFMGSGQPFVIGIVGKDPFGPHMDQVVQDERVGNRSITIKRYTTMEDVLKSPCQILFISQNFGQRWFKAKQQLAEHSILTVSDMARFAQMGGMVNIETQNNRLKIGINSNETRKAGLIVSAKLLKVARKVQSEIQESGK